MLWAFCLWQIATLCAQQPAYFMLGEAQFKGVQIYDVMQDLDQNYWFATNEGIYKYDNYKYEKIKCEESKSTSVFGFVINSEGTIYCHNLNRQIFQIKGRSCTLFYELQDDENHSDVSLVVNSNDQLLISAKKVIVVNKNGTVHGRSAFSNVYIGMPFKVDDAVIYHLAHKDSLLLFQHGKFSKVPLKTLSGKLDKKGVLFFFKIGQQLFAINNQLKSIYQFDAKQHSLSQISNNQLFQRSESLRLYQGEAGVWVAGTLPGIAFVENIEAQGLEHLYYQDYFISDVYKDKEGNILLSTFDKGVLVIPDRSIPDVRYAFPQDPIVSIRADADLGVLLGSSKGILRLATPDSLHVLKDKGRRPLGTLYCKAGFPLIIFADGGIQAYHKKTKKIYTFYDVSLKDVVVVDSQLMYLATNRGIVRTYWNGKDSFKIKELPGFNFRANSIEYDEISKQIYAATVNGLYAIELDGSSEMIRYKGEVIYANYLYCHEGTLYVAAKKSGIIVIKDRIITALVEPKVNGEVVEIFKMLIINGTLMAKTEQGLLQFSMQGDLIRQLNQSHGFSNNRIIDFDFYDNQLWVSHYGGVQLVDIGRFYKKNAVPLIRFSDLLVNDKPQKWTEKGAFRSVERKIQFTIASPTLRNKENIHYHHKLEGYDKEWIVNKYEDNQILYNALGPGHYTFLVKAENQGVFSETLRYSFSIAYPFYQRWWFIASAMGLFLLLVWGFYSRQLAIQRKKVEQLNELNASRLTAIQSQMNPHFIFNALNSIQDLVLKGDVENSYSYITTFSNLVRRTLSYSEKDFIDFEEEVKLIELYLLLEKLRFKKELNYRIETNDIEDILVPPMLVQPFIENALVHGLLHKTGDKRLLIRFDMEGEETLICTIEDNGVGREKAKAIKQRQGIAHESFAVKAIQKRFEILKTHFKGALGFEYEDLMSDGVAVGTRVRLKIPVQQKF